LISPGLEGSRELVQARRANNEQQEAEDTAYRISDTTPDGGNSVPRAMTIPRPKRFVFVLIMSMLGAANVSLAQNTLPVRWEALTTLQFVKAIRKAQNTCLLPFGIMESHAYHLPIGTDLYIARYAAVHAAEREYAVVFPSYYFGETAESLDWPGDVQYGTDLQMKLLQQTTDEMARNGCRKIITVNGHGTNAPFLSYFMNFQLASPHNYVVYTFPFPSPKELVPMRPPVPQSHAGEDETSQMLAIRPDLVHMNLCGSISGARIARLRLPGRLETAVFWYANSPNHYDGVGCRGNKKEGEADMKIWVNQLVTAIRFVKADKESPKLQSEFYKQAAHPLDTKPYSPPSTGTVSKKPSNSAPGR
jgi:creatinine amidohydrolase